MTAPSSTEVIPMSEVQEQVQDVLDELVASGTERGIAVAAYVDSVPVVDAVAGAVDGAGHPVVPGTDRHARQ